MPEDRRLAAIMFTDIVGYTALIGSMQNKAIKVPISFHLLIISLLLLFNCNSQQDKSVKSFDGSTIDYTVAGSGEPTLVFIQGGLGCNKHV